MKLGNKGFTLLEILIAITIMSFVTIGVNQIVNRSIDSQIYIIDEDKEYVSIQSALRRLEIDFERLHTPLFYDFPAINPNDEKKASIYDEDSQNPYSNHDNFDGVTSQGLPIPAIFFERNKEFIFFTRTNIRKYKNSKMTSFNWVRYRVDSSSERSGLERLTRQAINEDIYANELPWDKVPIYTLIDGIKKIEFFLWDPEKREWKDSIPENGKYFGPLLKIKLIWLDSQERQHLEQKVFRIFWPNFDTVRDEELKRKAAMGPGSPQKKEEEF